MFQINQVNKKNENFNVSRQGIGIIIRYYFIFVD